MTLQQIENLKTKIAGIKRSLAAEKKYFGAIHDSGGLRYLPTRYYLQIDDCSGGLGYTKWFSKNFPDDKGSPDFLFEWTIILYRNGKLKEAEQKAFETFCSNTYLFDKFYCSPIVPLNKWEGSNFADASFTDDFQYTYRQLDLADFAGWLKAFISTQKFISLSAGFLELNKRIKAESSFKKKQRLFEKLQELKKSI